MLVVVAHGLWEILKNVYYSVIFMLKKIRNKQFIGRTKWTSVSCSPEENSRKGAGLHHMPPRAQR